jgi:hypothetical protein
VADDLGRRFVEVRTSIATGDFDRLPGFLQGWARHCMELRHRITVLAERGELVFAAWGGTHEESAVDAATALIMLLPSYLHMTNNRLLVTIRDEAYLSYVLGRALSEVANPPGKQPEPLPALSASEALL